MEVQPEHMLLEFWKKMIAEYIYPLKLVEYKKNFRSNYMRNALQIFNKKQEEEKEWIRPIFRPKDWKREGIDKAKKNKRKQ